MVGVLTRLYGRMGTRYWWLLLATGSALAVVMPLMFLYVATVQYLGLSLHQYFHCAWIALVGVQIGTVIGEIQVIRRTIPAFRWMRGQKEASDAVAARRALTRMSSYHPRLVAPPIAIGALPAVFAINGIAHALWYQVLAIAFGSCVGIALGVAIHMAMTETIVRPVISEIDTLFPSTADELTSRTVSARPRIVVSSLLVVWSSAWLTAGLVARSTNPLQHIVLAVFTGLAIAILFGLSLALALNISIFAPMNELAEATRRVQHGDYTTRVPINNNDEMAEVLRSFNDMMSGLAEREALRAALGTYVEPSVAERLVAEGQVLASEEVDVTIMFVDIVGFSARAELMAPDAVCADLNEFFGLVVPLVSRFGGHTNKLIGDGLMAVFGAPIKLDDHADRALHAAFAIRDGLEQRYRGSLRAGVGLNSGSVVVGTMGGGTKLDFTVIGDVVNVASRVEALTRATEDPILITEATKHRLETEVALKSRGGIALRGRAEPVSIFAALSLVPA